MSIYLDVNRKWRTSEWVRTQLLSSEELRAFVGEKIFPVIAEEDTAGDFIIVYRSAYGRELVDAVLDGGRNDEVGRIFGSSGHSATLDASEEGFSEGKFYQSLTFEIS